MKDTFLSLFRHLLTLAGGIAISHGIVTQSQSAEIVGALVALAGFLWGSLDEWVAARNIEQEAKMKSAIEVAVAMALAAAAKNQTPPVPEPKPSA